MVYEQSGMRPLVVARLTSSDLVARAAELAMHEAAARADALRDTDLGRLAREEADRLQKVLGLLRFPVRSQPDVDSRIQ